MKKVKRYILTGLFSFLVSPICLAAEGTPNSYDSTWRGPVTDPDLYRENAWDPAIAGLEEYGWHYDWNTEQRRWQPDFGWHTGTFDYTSEEETREKRQDNRPRRLRGTIEAVDTVRLQNRDGVRGEHAVARLKLERGETILVNFGDEPSRPSSVVQEGEEVAITGRMGRINGRKALFADTVRKEGQVIRVRREGSASNRSGPRNGRSDNVLFSGLIQEVMNIRLNNESGETQRFLQIFLESGEVALIDTGSEATFQALGITEGDQVAVRGSRDQISGRDYIRATVLRINGAKVDLSRPSGEALSDE